MENCVRNWEDRKLSLFGKSTLIKSKFYGMLNHVMQHTFLLPDQLTRIDNLISRFLWRGPRLMPIDRCRAHRRATLSAGHNILVENCTAILRGKEPVKNIDGVPGN